MRNLTPVVAMLLCVPLATAGIAPPPDDFADVYVTIDGGRLTTSRLIDLGGGTFDSEPARCFAGEFGESGIPNFADDPGFYSDALPAGFQLSFNILDAARLWNGADFSTISATGLTLTAAAGVPGAPEATTPPVGDAFVPGFAFVTADGSGPYNHSAVLWDGRLEGLTNSTGRDFLSYWSAVKL
jgi:hypothetical protein